MKPAQKAAGNLDGDRIRRTTCGNQESAETACALHRVSYRLRHAATGDLVRDKFGRQYPVDVRQAVGTSLG